MVAMIFRGGVYDKQTSDAINAERERGMGDNAPPDPFTLYNESIDDLLLEAANFLDGGEIENEDQEAAVASILTRLRREANAADDQRKAEAKPFDDGKAEVQAKWKPLLAKADTAVATAKNVLTAFLVKKEAAQRAAADAAAQEARELAEAAAQTARDANPTSLADQVALETSRRAAHEAAQRATRLDKAKPQAKGGERAVGLRTSYRAEITDPILFGKWAWEHRRAEYLTFLEELAERESRGGDKAIPGLKVHTERKAA
jgi:hypothetical protein